MVDGDPILDLRGVSKRFGGVVAVDDVDLRFYSGSLTALVGPNGAGKTSLFNVVAGTLKADSGEVRFAGSPITRRRPEAIARAGLRRTFQNPRPFRALTVLENTVLGAAENIGERLGRVFISPRSWRRREAEIVARARELLQVVRLDDKEATLAGALSGGQRKLLELARVLMSEPKLVLLDEPIAGVNQALREELARVIVTVHESRLTTFVLIEHDLDFVARLSDRVVVMDAGRVIADGAADEVWSNAAVIEAYLGRSS